MQWLHSGQMWIVTSGIPYLYLPSAPHSAVTLCWVTHSFHSSQFSIWAETILMHIWAAKRSREQKHGVFHLHLDMDSLEWMCSSILLRTVRSLHGARGLCFQVCFVDVYAAVYQYLWNTWAKKKKVLTMETRFKYNITDVLMMQMTWRKQEIKPLFVG